MSERMRSDVARTTLVCIDSCEQGVPAGRFYNYGQGGEGHPFSGILQLIVNMEQMLDDANFPQAFTAKRTFAEAASSALAGVAGADCRNGELATFLIKVFFRQHTSWQGSVTWQEKQAEQSFRSVLELMLLMDSALNSNE